MLPLSSLLLLLFRPYRIGFFSWSWCFLGVHFSLARSSRTDGSWVLWGGYRSHSEGESCMEDAAPRLAMSFAYKLFRALYIGRLTSRSGDDRKQSPDGLPSQIHRPPASVHPPSRPWTSIITRWRTPSAIHRFPVFIRPHVH